MPKTRDDDFVRKAVALASDAKPFAGHKTTPLLARWPGFDWIRYNVPEIMHGKNTFTAFIPARFIIIGD